jgi:hypothetical protein
VRDKIKPYASFTYIDKKIQANEEIINDPAKKQDWLEKQRHGIGYYIGMGIYGLAGLYLATSGILAIRSFYRERQALKQILIELEAAAKAKK